MSFNRSDLLAQVNAAGYTGKPEPAEVKSFLASKGMDTDTIEVPGEGDKVAFAKFDDIWGKTATLRLTTPDAADTLDQDTALEDAEKKAAAEASRPGFGFRKSALVRGQVAVIDNSRDRATKSYERRIKMRDAAPHSKDAAIFDTPEDAEAFGAWARINVATGMGREHKLFGSDCDSLKRWCQKTGVGYSNVLGGATVPQEFMAQLIWRTEFYGAARKVANVVRMSRDNTIVPRKTGIVSMSFTQEGSTPTAQDNSYDNIELTARKAMALVQVSNEWLEDSAISVADDYANTFAEAQAKLEDQCFFLGDGSATYGGFNGLIGALPTSAYLSATAWSSLALTNFNTMMGSVENVYNGDCVFVCSRQFYHQVMVRLDKAASQFKDWGTAGTTGFNGADGVFLGFPVVFAQVLPTASATSNKSCYFGAIKYAGMLGDRRDLNVAVSRDYYFGADSTAIRATSRIAVNIHGDGRASTYGPVVCQQGN